MRMELDFTFKNAGEAEAFMETAKTYPGVLAAECDQDDNIVMITDEGKARIAKVLRDLAMCFDHGPAVGRYEWKTTK